MKKTGRDAASLGCPGASIGAHDNDIPAAKTAFAKEYDLDGYVMFIVVPFSWILKKPLLK